MLAAKGPPFHEIKEFERRHRHTSILSDLFLPNKTTLHSPSHAIASGFVAGELIGKDLREYHNIQNCEVNDFRWKMKTFANNLAQGRRKRL